LEGLDQGILDARHIEEPGYSAYGMLPLSILISRTMMLMFSLAVVHVASSLIIDDLARLIDHVKALVGETDFSFKVSTDSDSDSSATPPESKGKTD
jgi:hypothetical protein